MSVRPRAYLLFASAKAGESSEVHLHIMLPLCLGHVPGVPADSACLDASLILRVHRPSIPLFCMRRREKREGEEKKRERRGKEIEGG